MAAIARDATGGASLIDYVGGTPGVDTGFAETTYLAAYGLVIDYLGSLVLDPDTDDADVAAVSGAVLEVAAKLWDRRNAPGGEVSIELGGAPTRLAPVDPLVTAYPVLDRVLSSHKDSTGHTLGGGFA